ncbi:hypothetical protein [Caloranaerobacter ferrireducens]|uniref:hypothetical protein n=1 Tax=Caloranaerobacter ferrireducens TaxID=1323370 RepID=UPI00159F0CC8|nr:hypothetical protein [Caloranaerobacter ferrireducens]
MVKDISKYYKELGKSIFKENINESELRYQENEIYSDDLISKSEFFKKINQIK